MLDSVKYHSHFANNNYSAPIRLSQTGKTNAHNISQEPPDGEEEDGERVDRGTARGKGQGLVRLRRALRAPEGLRRVPRGQGRRLLPQPRCRPRDEAEGHRRQARSVCQRGERNSLLNFRLVHLCISVCRKEYLNRQIPILLKLSQILKFRSLTANSLAFARMLAIV